MSEEKVEMKKIACQCCGEEVHVILPHLEKKHPGMTLAKYKVDYPDAPLVSDIAIERLVENKRYDDLKITLGVTSLAGIPGCESVAEEEKSEAPASENKEENATFSNGITGKQTTFDVVFGMKDEPRALGVAGNHIPIHEYDVPEELKAFIEDKDQNYVFNVEVLKDAMMGVEFNIPTFIHGGAGTGKSTLVEQISAHTKRPLIRVQHTRNTEESHVIGQYVVKDGATVFELGPLPYAMLNGLIYLADEYDFAPPSVTALYQPVLEGKSLVIKEAPPELRHIRPHPLFRMIATGNTNGTGDETGLYQGTMQGNAANYERFGVMIEMPYLPASIETEVLLKQGGIARSDSEKLVKFANLIREGFKSGEVGMAISTRALINACKTGKPKRSFAKGIGLSYINRLNSVDRQVAKEILDRVGIA